MTVTPMLAEMSGSIHVGLCGLGSAIGVGTDLERVETSSGRCRSDRPGLAVRRGEMEATDRRDRSRGRRVLPEEDHCAGLARLTHRREE